MPKKKSTKKASKKSEKKSVKSDMPSSAQIKATEKRKSELIAQIREGMPSVGLMRIANQRALNMNKAWERRTRPLLAELDKLSGKPVSVEKFRPGRE